MAKTGTLKFWGVPYTPQARNSSDFAQYHPLDIFRRQNARSNAKKSKNLELLKIGADIKVFLIYNNLNDEEKIFNSVITTPYQ